MAKLLTFLSILQIINKIPFHSALIIERNREEAQPFLKNSLSETEDGLEQKSHKANDAFEYNAEEAEMMLAFSAATYATKKSVGTKDCLDNINKKHNIDSVHFGRHKKTNCDIFGNTCSVDISIVRDKKQIIIAFEGTNHHSQLLRQAFSVLFQDTVDVHGSEFGKVNRYYLNAVKQLWLDIEGAFILYPDYAPIFVGHSMGGCLASIAALLYAIECKVNSEENELNKKDISNKEHKPYFNEDQLEKIKQLTFGEPRHGDKLYAKKHNELIPHSIRYVNEEDVIAQMPFCTKFQTLFAPVLKNTALACEAIGYLHQGQEVWFKFGMKRPPIICHPPTNLVLEDNSCSASQEFHLRDSSKREKYINDHQTYFNSWVFYYGEAGCDSEKIKLHVDLVEPHYKKNEALRDIWREHQYNLSLRV